MSHIAFDSECLHPLAVSAAVDCRVLVVAGSPQHVLAVSLMDCPAWGGVMYWSNVDVSIPVSCNCISVVDAIEILRDCCYLCRECYMFYCVIGDACSL